MNALKHVGRVIGTGKRCLVAYRTLPGDAYSCLIIPTESLPDSYHDAIINLVESNAGQTAHEFAEALDRTQFPDGSRMLPALHAQGRLIKMLTNQIEMVPTNATAILLAELNQIIADNMGIPVDELSIKSDTNNNSETPEQSVDKDPTVQVDSPNVDNSNTTTASVDPVMDPTGAAKFYRSQADKLAKEAAQFRRLAEELVPTVKKSKASV